MRCSGAALGSGAALSSGSTGTSALTVASGRGCETGRQGREGGKGAAHHWRRLLLGELGGADVLIVVLSVLILALGRAVAHMAERAQLGGLRAQDVGAERLVRDGIGLLLDRLGLEESEGSEANE